MDPREQARRVLPWIIMPKFKNVLTHFPDSIINKIRMENQNQQIEIGTRELELYVAEGEKWGGLYIPGASTFLTVPYIKYDVEIDEKRKIMTVTSSDGFIQGFAPDGTYVKYRTLTIDEKDGPIELEYDANFTEFATGVVVRNVYRLLAGKYFARRIASIMRKKFGVKIIKEKEEIKIGDVVVSEGHVRGTVPIVINLYLVGLEYNNYVTPGVVPGILQLIEDGILKPYDEKTEEVLTNFMEKITRIGKRVSPISGGILQKTSKTKFTYYLGEIDAPDTVINTLKRKMGDSVWLGGGPAYRGTRVNFYVNLTKKKFYMTISILPFNPPATIVLNYPPFNIAPISALMNERYAFLEYNIKREVIPRARRLGLDVGSFHRELQVLGDAGITFDEVRGILKDGYPRLDKLEVVAEKAEKLGNVADLVSMISADVYKIDKLLISLIEPKAKKTEQKNLSRRKEEETKEDEEDEPEGVLL